MPDAQQPQDVWNADALLALLQTPLLELLHRAQTVHRAYQPNNAVQMASLLSIKTGGCPEDCAYCPQSAHYDTPVAREGLMAIDDVMNAARQAKAEGATRFCMGAAWKKAKKGAEFDAVLEMVRGVRGLGLEACVTLGMLDRDQAHQLKDAGLTSYNHNLDTSRDFYGEIITTRSYDERLETLAHASEAGISLCTGGIIGMGESWADRAAMLAALAALDPQPGSVPINALVPVEGTPLADRTPVDPIDLVRMCAAARIAMPKARVRLSAGRNALSREAQILCFMAGANSIFAGDKLLTTPNVEEDADKALLDAIGARPLAPFEDAPA